MKKIIVRAGLALCGMLLVTNAHADASTVCSAKWSSPKAAQISKATTNLSTAIQIDVLSATSVPIGGWGLGYGPVGAVPKGTLTAMALTSCTKNGTAIAAATTAIAGDVISCPIPALPVTSTGIEVALFDTLADVTAKKNGNIIDIHQFMTACTLGKGTYWAPPTGTLGCAPALQASACITQILQPPVLGMTASSSSAIVGSNPSFTLTATNPNLAAALTNVVVTDVIPVGMTYISNTPTLGAVAVAGQTLTWTIPSLPAGGSATLTLVVTPTAKGSYTNTATSPGATPASATILVLPSAITRYSMDEAVGLWTGANGEVIDSGGNALNGHRRTVTAPTATNTFAPGPAPALAPTIASQYPDPPVKIGDPVVKNGFCNAGYFDGKAVVESASSNFFQFTNQLSASAWVYPTAFPTGGGLYSILSNDTNYEFHLNSSGRLFWWWGASTLTSAQAIPLNQWTHVAFTMDSSGVAPRQRIYINGVADTATNNWSGTLTKNNCPFYIGGDVLTDGKCTLAADRSFHGMIDEAKVYNYELTAAEVQADMTLGRMCTANKLDHIRIEHDGSASPCASKTVTLKACADAACTNLYTGAVTLTLSPPGWTPTDTVTFSGGVTTATLSNTSLTAPGITLGATVTSSPAPTGITRCFNGATETCTLGVAAGTSCKFDAAEVGANPKTQIFTKLAGTAFQVDILAVGVPNTTVDTTKTSTVSVDLVDTSKAVCDGTSTALNPTPYAVTLVSGRITATMTCATPATSVQVRIRSGNKPKNYTYACSTDKFSVRPSAVTLSSTKVQATPPNPTDANKIVAGALFNISATTTPTSYTGMLSQDKTKLTAQLPSDVTQVIAGGTVGALEMPSTPTNLPLSLLANAVQTNNATYSEVGYLYVNPGAFSDAIFTSVDQAGQVAGCAATDTCDCLLSSTMTNAGVPDNLSDVLINKRYGCYVGNKTRFALGRFIPDHFDTAVYQASGVPMGCPTGLTCPTSYNGFVYSGQAFPVQVTAASLGGGATLNYYGNFAKAVTLQAWDAPGSTATQDPSGAFTNGSILAASFGVGKGVATTVTPTFTLATATTNPTDVFIRAVDADGVTSQRATTSVEGGVKVAVGRMKIANAYGSELLKLPISATVQLWNGAIWQTSTTDSLTSFDTSTNLVATIVKGPLTAAKVGAVNGGVVTVVNGVKTFTLKSPGTGFSGSADLSLDVPLYLLTGSNGAKTNPSVAGRATFGVYKGANEFIYMRETY